MAEKWTACSYKYLSDDAIEISRGSRHALHLNTRKIKIEWFKSWVLVVRVREYFTSY